MVTLNCMLHFFLCLVENVSIPDRYLTLCPQELRHASYVSLDFSETTSNLFFTCTRLPLQLTRDVTNYHKQKNLATLMEYEI